MEKQDNCQQPAAAPQITRQHVTIVKARNRRLALIFVSMCVLLILAASVYTGMYLLDQRPQEEGRILNNVYVGGINIGGMTREDAQIVVRLTIESVITSQDLVVRLDHDALIISPQEVGLTMDVDALIDDAYNYGRTGSFIKQKLMQEQSRIKEHHIALIPYLKMDLNAVYDRVRTFCAGYRITLTQPSVSLVGDRPAYTEAVDTVTHQTMMITLGTPQANLTADDLYAAVLDGYSLFQLELYYDPPVVVLPDTPDAQAIFDQYCLSPKDAEIDNKSYAVTPEVYGYGFDIAAVQRRIDRASYGETIEVTLGFMMPDITAEALAGHLFKDTLATYTSVCTDPNNANRNKNLSLACAKIDGYVIKVGESFDFNAIFGELSTIQGYAFAPTYSNSSASTVGGGISQVSSALHYCALLAQLQINERHAHRYAVDYTPLGTDAAISYGSENLVFTNNTTAPIRILASVKGSTVTITLLGTKTSNHNITIEQEILFVYEPHTSYQLMAKDNVYGYKDGDVLQVGLEGYVMQLYRCHYSPTTGALISKEVLDLVSYASREAHVVRIGTADDTEMS